MLKDIEYFCCHTNAHVFHHVALVSDNNVSLNCLHFTCIPLYNCCIRENTQAFFYHCPPEKSIYTHIFLEVKCRLMTVVKKMRNMPH